MSTETGTEEKKQEEHLSARLRKAQLSLTEEELQFFPKTDSMPDQPESQWIPSKSPVVVLSD